MDLVFLIGCEKGSVERVMDLPCFGEVELIGDGERTLMIVKGPSHFGVNFGLAIEHLRFLASSPTLLPLAKGVNPRLFCEDMTWRVSSCAARASSQAVMRDFRRDSTVGIEESEIKEGRARGSYPIMR